MNKKQTATPPDPIPSDRKQSPWAVPMILLVVAGFALAIYFLKQPGGEATPPAGLPSAPPVASASLPPVQTSAPVAPSSTEPQTMPVAQAVMVTAELSVPTGTSIAQALSQIERQYRPDDGQGRTFAILDAYGETTPDGKLHMSMHVSSEKPGTGALVFKPTGEVLWQAKITGTAAAGTKSLNVYIGDDSGTGWIVEGSGNPASILDAKLRDKSMTVREFWPDGAEREVTFVYSACGCPVKAMVKRVGDSTARTKDLPVIFPDDPAAVQVISRLMRWPT